MTLDEYNRRLGGVISDLQGGAHGDVMMQVANDALRLVRQRVQEKGLNIDGGGYRDYSKSYKAQKEKEGKYRGFVDFTYSSRMWNNIALVSDRNELDKGVAVIRARSSENQDKLNKNTKSRGPILAVSENEKGVIMEIYNEGILRIFRRNGL